MALGTPGRLCALLEQGLLPTSRLRLLVLDEADKLLEGSLADDVAWIAALMPGANAPDRTTDTPLEHGHSVEKNQQPPMQAGSVQEPARCQVLALSATFPPPIRQQLTARMHRPQHVLLSPDDVSLVGVAQRYVVLHEDGNDMRDVWRAWLLQLLSSVMFTQAVVFCNRKADAAWLAGQLQAAGYAAAYVAGGQAQVRRHHDTLLPTMYPPTRLQPCIGHPHRRVVCPSRIPAASGCHH